MDAEMDAWNGSRPLKCMALALAALGVLGACTKAEPPAAQPRLVKVVKAGSDETEGVTSYTGEVRARYETALAFRVAGKINARLVEVGERVRAGQPLARLDPADQRLLAENARQQLVAAELNLAQTESDIRRFKELFEKGFISPADFDRRMTGLRVAAAQLEQIRAQLSLAQNQSAYTTLAAEHAGVVTQVAGEVGQVVAAGQMVFKVARPGEMEVWIPVPENRLGELGKARSVSVDLWADPDRRYGGRVRELAPSADPVTRTYTAKVTVLEPGPAVQLGMTANVRFATGVHEGALSLPGTALFKKGDQPAVWVVDPASSQVQLRPVTVSTYHEDHVSVTGGLQPGEVVVRAGVHKLFAGEKVRIAADAPQ
jgi:multidrug efflux system membrane fusion protein